MFDGIFLKFVQSLLAEKPDKRIVSFSFKNKTYFVKRRMSNGRNTFAKKDPSTAFWCEAYKIMTVNARLPLAPKIVLLDEDFFVMEGAGKTLQGVAKEAEYADVRRDAFEKAGRLCGTSPTIPHRRPSLSSTGKTKRNSSTHRHRCWTCFSSCTAVSVKNGRTMTSSMPLSPVMAAFKAATRPSLP